MDSEDETSFYLHRIMDERCILTAHLEDHGIPIMTAIVDILDDDGVMIFDCSDSKEVDRMMRQSPSIDFSTCVDDISITFSTGPVKDTVYKGRPAYKIRIPDSIDRAQRRDFFRVSPPLSERPECVMECDGNIYKATIVDISLGGISAFVDGALFRTGDVIERCKITTPIGIEIEASLEVMYVGNSLDGKLKMQYGCRFREDDAALESKLQKYVMYLQQVHARKRE